MALNHTNPGAQPRESRAQPVAPKRTTPGPQHRQYSTPIPAETPSTDATGNLTGSSQRRELSGANPGSLLPEPDDVYLTHTATTREDLQTLAPAVPLTVADRLGEADTTLDHDLAEWQAGQGPRPRLSVLGPIYARVGTGGNPLAAAKRRAFYTELLAYLWSQPHGATTAQVTPGSAVGGQTNRLSSRVD